MHSQRSQFLYVLLKETYARTKDETTSVILDTALRVVYWKPEELGEDAGYFVLYGTRYEKDGVSFRVRFDTIRQIVDFAKSILSDENSIAVELHQFDGLNDVSQDWLNIDWENTEEGKRTELAAWDCVSGECCFEKDLCRVLWQLTVVELV